MTMLLALALLACGTPEATAADPEATALEPPTSPSLPSWLDTPARGPEDGRPVDADTVAACRSLYCLRSAMPKGEPLRYPAALCSTLADAREDDEADGDPMALLCEQVVVRNLASHGPGARCQEDQVAQATWIELEALRDLTVAGGFEPLPPRPNYGGGSSGLGARKLGVQVDREGREHDLHALFCDQQIGDARLDVPFFSWTLLDDAVVTAGPVTPPFGADHIIAQARDLQDVQQAMRVDLDGDGALDLLALVGPFGGDASTPVACIHTPGAPRCTPHRAATRLEADTFESFRLGPGPDGPVVQHRHGSRVIATHALSWRGDQLVVGPAVPTTP